MVKLGKKHRETWSKTWVSESRVCTRMGSEKGVTENGEDENSDFQNSDCEN